MNDSSKSNSAGTEWALRSWYTTIDGDRVALLYRGTEGDRRAAVMYSYAWPHTPQFIEFEDRSDAVRSFVAGREASRGRSEIATIGADVMDGGE
jgi:hypothetical protein